MRSILKKTGPCARLIDLRPGEGGRLCTHHPDGVSRRLRDLGFVPGTSLRVIRAAPLGDPVEVELRSFRLCLRRADVADVCVTPEPPGS
ncbi:MAG: ferrous iron transport protein A [Myxococcota bacterium]